MLRPNKNQEYEAMRDEQGRDDCCGNEKRCSERPGIDVESLSVNPT